MIGKFLRAGDKVELKKYNLAEATDEKSRLYNSQLLDIKNDGQLDIAVPIEGGRIIPLEIGGRYELRFITTSGIYICKAEISNRCKQGNLYYLVMGILSELRKDQRRQYYRLEKIKPLGYHKVEGEEEDALTKVLVNRFESDLERRTIVNRLREIKGQDRSGTLSNISGGGIKFHSDEELKAGDLIRIRLLLDDADVEPLDLFARVVASEKAMNKNMSNEHRIEFVNINRDTREKIVKYVFSEERKQRQKESGAL